MDLQQKVASLTQQDSLGLAPFYSFRDSTQTECSKRGQVFGVRQFIELHPPEHQKYGRSCRVQPHQPL